MTSVYKTKTIVKKIPVIKPNFDHIAIVLTIRVLITIVMLTFSKSITPILPAPSQ